MNDYTPLINEEIEFIKSIFSSLFQQGGYHYSSGSLYEIIFSNPQQKKLIFVYTPDRYTAGKHMFLGEVKLQQGAITKNLLELAEEHNSSLDTQNYFMMQKEKKSAYQNVLI